MTAVAPAFMVAAGLLAAAELPKSAAAGPARPIQTQPGPVLGPALAPEPAPGPAPAFNAKMSPAEAGARLIQAFIAGDPPARIAPYFEEEVRPNLTEAAIEDFRLQLSWLADVLGDALAVFATGTRPLPDGETGFFREYRFAHEADRKHPMVVIQVVYADSLTNKAAGAFVKTFVPDSRERKIGEARQWNVEGRRTEIHSLTLIEFEPGFLFAVKVDDSDTVTMDTREAALPYSAPIAREAVARGWLDSARAVIGTSAKPLLEEIGVLFMRVDPKAGYTHFRHTVLPEEYAPVAKKVGDKKAESKKGK